MKLREKDEKCVGIESRSMGWEFRVLTTRPQVLNFEYKVKILLQKIDKKKWPLQNFIFIPLTKASSKNSLLKDKIATSSDRLHCKYLWLNKELFRLQPSGYSKAPGRGWASGSVLLTKTVSCNSNNKFIFSAHSHVFNTISIISNLIVSRNFNISDVL